MGAAQIAIAEQMSDRAGAVGIGTTSSSGRALVVEDPAVAFSMIDPGDVVVTRFTSPSWSSVLVYACALVTTPAGPCRIPQ